ncbi:DUF1622 domain-containing protein [Terriglobus sp. TAA 43]|uniref:DUF1622 domain-containing protein n=1 Tax=Terriglobus sp. TAA 43 TaxID=278961 RepID=UPI00068FA662|nr:DUF1622 domain-containing protein [Terriglobus sp. TAA 43]
MEEILKSFWGIAATIVEGAAAFLITLGAAQAFVMSIWRFRAATREKMQIWMHFATWLLLGLEFELAADVIRTAIAPTWSDIGQLAAIAAIRTFLSYFLDEDIEKVNTSREDFRPQEGTLDKTSSI